MAYEQSTSEHDLIGRRQAICTLAGISTALAGIALIGGVGSARVAEVTFDEQDQNGDLPTDTVSAQQVVEKIEFDEKAAHELALVEALIPTDLDLGKWSIVKVEPSRLGAIPVVMRGPSGEVFQVDVLRRDESKPGVADTKHLGLFVANSGDGSTATDELQARGTKVLAYHLRRTETRGTPLPKLMTFSERSRRHPFGDFGVLG